MHKNSLELSKNIMLQFLLFWLWTYLAIRRQLLALAGHTYLNPRWHCLSTDPIKLSLGSSVNYRSHLNLLGWSHGFPWLDPNYNFCSFCCFFQNLLNRNLHVWIPISDGRWLLTPNFLNLVDINYSAMWLDFLYLLWFN